MTNVKHHLDEIDLLDAPDGWEEVRRRVARADLRIRIDEPQRARAAKVGAALVAFAIFIVAGGLVWEGFHTGPSRVAGSEIDLPTDPGAVFTVPGLAFPVCRGSQIEGTFTGHGVEHAYVFTRASASACPAVGEGLRVLAVGGGEDGSISAWEPIDCGASCLAWANPDIDADGKDEIAIESRMGASTLYFVLFDVVDTPRGWALSPIVHEEDGTVVQIAYGGSVTHLDGAFCDPASHTFVVWSAEPNASQTEYRIHQQPYRLVGGDVTPATALPPRPVLRRLDPIDSIVPLDPSVLPRRGIESCRYSSGATPSGV